MSYQKERDQFVSVATKEGVPLWLITTLLRSATTLQRIAELECSSEAADRDRVPCPGVKAEPLCCCDFGYAKEGQHEDVPRVTAQGKRIEARLVKQLAEANPSGGYSLVFNGDPRGYVVLLTVPSGKTTDWGRRGIGVPSGPSRICW